MDRCPAVHTIKSPRPVNRIVLLGGLVDQAALRAREYDGGRLGHPLNMHDESIAFQHGRNAEAPR
jgi:hypothetical protein